MSSTSPKDIKSSNKQSSFMEGNIPYNQQEANQTIPNYDFNNNSVPKAIKNDGRKRDRCLFCCTPKVLMTISIIYLIVGVIHAIAQLMNVFGCRDLYGNLDSVSPSILSYDQNTIPTLNVKVTEYWNRYDELWISQTNDTLATNTTIQIRFATKNSNGQYTTAITPSEYNLNIVKGNTFEPFWGLWTSRCVVSRVEVILPRQRVMTTTSLSSPVNINSYGFDIKFKQNSVPYAYPINFKTTSSDINIENILSTNTTIKSTSGDIKGSIISLNNGINIESTSGDINVNVKVNNTNTIGGIIPRVGLKSTSGDINLALNVSNIVFRPVVDVSATSGDIHTDINLANGITDSQITIKATSGDVDLNLHNTFEGNYQITTTSGDVNVGIGNNKNHNRQGRIGSANSQGFLNIGVTSGDVNVAFS